MRKIIKVIGNSIGITFNKEQQKTYDLKVEDVIDVTFRKVRKIYREKNQ